MLRFLQNKKKPVKRKRKSRSKKEKNGRRKREEHEQDARDFLSAFTNIQRHFYLSATEKISMREKKYPDGREYIVC